MNQVILTQLAKELSEVAEQSGLFEIKSIDGFRLNIRASVRAFWLGVTDYDGFLTDMVASIQRGFRQAWLEGMKEFGYTWDDMSETERAALRLQISQESQFLEGFADFVEKNRKSEGGKLSIVNKRAELWVRAYNRVREIAKTYAGQDQKMRWQLGEAEHCSSCLKLSGKVKRASYWQSQNIYPGAWDKLECKLGCQCSLVSTDEPLSRGPLPNLP